MSTKKGKVSVVSISKRKAIEMCLQHLAEKHDRLTPDMVVNEAEKATSPLHSEFEWDDSAAARSYRIEQARALIRSVRIVVRTDKTTITSVAYVRDPNVGGAQGYLSVKKVRTDMDQSRDVLRNEFGRATSILERVRDLAEAFGIESELNEVLDRLNILNANIQDPLVAAEG